MRYLWLFLSALLFVLSLLTLFKAPTLLGWKLALMTDEYGHFLTVGALLLALTSWRGATFIQSRPAMERVTLIASILAFGLLLGPSIQAWRISRRLPERFAQAFHTGAANTTPPAFRVRDLLRIHASPTFEPHTYVYANSGGVALQLDFYPAHPTLGSAMEAPPAPCVLIVHGGGWNNGDRTQLPALNSWLAERGYAVASIDYRLAPEWIWPAPKEDTEAALHWLQGHAVELQIDPKRFILMGRSAGGQIALAVGFGSTRHEWRGIISLYGPADLNFAYKFGDENDVLHSLSLLRHFLGGTPDSQPARYSDASPYLHVSSDLPPVLLLHGKLDTLVWHRQSERLDAVLQAAGVPHLFVSLPWGTHAFDFNLNGPGGQLTRNLIERYLQFLCHPPIPPSS